jgi:subtilisin family serine protease
MRVFLAVILLALVVGVMPVTRASADVFDPKDYYEIVIELDEGIDPLNYADYFLGQLGVTDAQNKAFRVNHVYEVALTGFSVYLTYDEYQKAERLELVGLHSMTESKWGDVSVIPITEVEGAMPTHALDPNQEIVPFNISRAGAQPDGVDYSSVDIAVIDTGVDQFHEDLTVVGGEDCVATYGQTPNYGFDGYGHGTHVAGTIAARANGVGVVGVAPGARIWSYKVLDASGSGSFASVLCGIEAVAANADIIDVANMSLGGAGRETACGGVDPMHNGICAATDLGVIFVVAAGNSSANASGHIPASYDEVVTVSAFADFDGQTGGAGVPPQDRCFAMSVDDELAAFSNYGEDVDISAPGTCVISTLPGTSASVATSTHNYGYASGTSMASPMVAGCVGKYLAVNPDQAEFAVRQITQYSTAKSAPVKGDHDGLHEPLLYCDAVPRWAGSENDYEQDGA